MKKDEINLDIKNGYDLWSLSYDTDENPLIYLEEKVVLKLIDKVKNKKVLDVGCGTGRISIKLLKKGAKVFGIDVSNKMLQKARDKTKKYRDRCEFKIASLYKIPYKKQDFDFVICSLVLSHIKNLDKAISEMSRVLKRNGIMIISDLHPYAILQGAATTFFRGKKMYRIKNYVYLFEDLFKSFRKNKLKIVDVKELKLTKNLWMCISNYVKNMGEKF